MKERSGPLKKTQGEKNTRLKKASIRPVDQTRLKHHGYKQADHKGYEGGSGRKRARNGTTERSELTNGGTVLRKIDQKGGGGLNQE